MSRKLIFLILLLVFSLMTSARSSTIIWVSDAYDDNADGEPDDQPWLDLLETNGYTVDTSFRSQEGRSLDDSKIEALNAADLIIVSRNSDSASYANDATEISQWNSITTPLMLQNIYIARNNINNPVARRKNKLSIISQPFPFELINPNIPANIAPAANPANARRPTYLL